MAFQCTSHSFQFCVLSKLAEGTLRPFVQVIDEEVEQDWAEYSPLGNPTSYRPPTRLCTTEYVQTGGSQSRRGMNNKFQS